MQYRIRYIYIPVISYTISHTISYIRDIIYDIRYDIVYNIRYNIFGQGGLVPALEPQEVLGLITGSEQFLKDYAKSASLTAKDVK